MGTVSERNGNWYIDFRYKGKRIRRKVGPSKRKAQEALRKAMADAINDKFNLAEARRMTFSELAEYWLENYSRIENAPSQYGKNRERLGNHLLPFFGDCEITNITPRMIDEYKNSKFGSLKRSTINRTLAILRKMFNDAIRWGFIHTSPMRKVKQLREDEQGFDYYSEDEMRSFLENCPPSFKSNAELACYTGMRYGEIIALRKKNVDLKRGIICVERSANGSTKSRKVRYIPINSKLMKVLEEQMKKTDSELVFPDENGQMRSTDFRTEMKNAAKKAGLRKIRFHDLRHTFASNFVIKGGNLLSLQKILGHSTISMTLRYAHLAPDFMASEIEVLDFESRRSPDGPREEAYS